MPKQFTKHLPAAAFPRLAQIIDSKGGLKAVAAMLQGKVNRKNLHIRIADLISGRKPEKDLRKSLCEIFNVQESWLFAPKNIEDDGLGVNITSDLLVTDASTEHGPKLWIVGRGTGMKAAELERFSNQQNKMDINALQLALELCGGDPVGILRFHSDGKCWPRETGVKQVVEEENYCKSIDLQVDRLLLKRAIKGSTSIGEKFSQVRKLLSQIPKDPQRTMALLTEALALLPMTGS